MNCTFDVIAKISLPSLISQKCILIFSSRSLTVLIFPFRSMIHLEFIFTHGMRYSMGFFFFGYAVVPVLHIRKIILGTSLVIQWLRLHFHCRGHWFDPWLGN